MSSAPAASGNKWGQGHVTQPSIPASQSQPGINPMGQSTALSQGSVSLETGQSMSAHLLQARYGLETYSCSECAPSEQMAFFSRNELKQHLESAHGIVGAHQCNQCHKSFHTRMSLQQHVRVVHRTGRRNICRICNKLLSTGQKLRHHVLRFHPDNVSEAIPEGSPSSRHYVMGQAPRDFNFDVVPTESSLQTVTDQGVSGNDPCSQN